MVGHWKGKVLFSEVETDYSSCYDTREDAHDFYFLITAIYDKYQDAKSFSSNLSLTLVLTQSKEQKKKVSDVDKPVDWRIYCPKT